MVKPVVNLSVSSIPSTPGTSAPKRKRLSEEEAVVLNPKAKPQRTRVSYSCGECHRRKQKCDRQIPCSHCLARKVPELCKAYTPGKSEQDFNARLSRLEHIIEMALPQYCTSGTLVLAAPDMNNVIYRARSTSPGADDEDRSNSEEQDPGSFQAGKWYGSGVSGSVAPGSVLEQLENAVSPVSPRDKVHSRHSSLKGPAGTMLSPGLAAPDSDAPSADDLLSATQENGISTQLYPDLLQELPPQIFSDVLVDFYFKSINWTRYPISERDFRSSYSALRLNGVQPKPTDVRFLPLLFVVLAIAIRLAPDRIGGDPTVRKLTSVRWYWYSRRSLLLAAATQPDSIDAVLTRLLSARFLTFDRRITECWSQLGAAVRTAQALGLHRDGTTMRMDAAQTEYRRRIWAYLYHADRSYALALGRPNAIQDDYTSTKAPSNIEDDLSIAQIRNPLPLSTPTQMTFVILRHALASIIGRMVHHFQQVRSPSHYTDVVALDDELIKFITSLPPHFSLEPDTSLDGTLPYIPIHRFLLITEVLFVRISLHRPYLLRRLESDRYLRSRAACFESAIKDFEVRQAFRKTMPMERQESLSNAYREFQTAMISGIYLVIEPNGRDAQAMHAILDAFVAEHKDSQHMDETTRRELRTIEFLKAKASDMEGRATKLPPGLTRDTSTSSVTGDGHGSDAQLLLSLHKGSRSSKSRSPSRPTFPSMATALTTPLPSPSISLAANPTTYTHRRQHSSNGETFVSSPGSSSPSADDESAAQSLLDQFYNTISNDPLGGSMAATNWTLSAGNDAQLWTTNAVPVDSSLLMGLENSDWNYWETLVSQIPVRGGPSIS